MLAVGREAHVGAVQRQRLAAADGFFAQALHVEGHLLLALGNHHAAVEDPRLEHGAHALTKDLRVNVFGPGALRVALLVEHADQAVGQVGSVGSIDIDRGFTGLTCIVEAQVGKSVWQPGRPVGSGTCKRRGRTRSCFLRSLGYLFCEL